MWNPKTRGKTKGPISQRNKNKNNENAFKTCGARLYEQGPYDDERAGWPNLERPSEAFSLFSKRFDRHIFFEKNRPKTTEWNSLVKGLGIGNDPTT